MGVVNREGALYMALGMDVSGLYSSAKQAEGIIGQLESTAKKAGVAMAGYFAFDSLKGIGKEIINVRGEVQMLEKSFNVLLGSESAAVRMLAEIKQYAVESPLSLSGVSNAAQTLLGFNIEAERVIPTIKQIGDITMGNQERFKSLILAFSQMSSAGRLMGQDLLQMINAGFNSLQIMAEKTEKSLAQLKKEMEDGAISSEAVADAFRQATEAGGKFYGMTQQQATGIKGLQAQLKGGFEEMYNSLGKSSEAIITQGYEMSILLVKNYETVGKALMSLVTTYGAYRAAVALNIAVESGWTLSQLAQYRTLLMVEKAQKLLNATMRANPYVLVTTLVVGLVTAMWALRDSTTAAEREQKKLNDQLQQIDQAIGERKANTESLIAIIKAETNTDFERLKALKELQALYPGIFSSMDIHAVKLAEEMRLKKELNQADEEYRKAQLKENLTNARSEFDKIREEIRLLEKSGERWSPAGMARLGQLQDQARAVGQTVIDYTFKLREFENAANSAPAKVLSYASGEIKETTDKIARLKKEIADLQSDKTGVSEEDGKVSNSIKAKKKELDEAESVLADLTGIDKKATTEHEKQAKDRLKAEKDLADAILNIRKYLSDGEVELKEEGYDKEQAVLKRQHAKRLEDIQELGENMLKAKQEAEKLAGKVTTISIDQLPDSQINELVKLKQQADLIREKSEQDLIEKYLAKYKTYAESRLEIEKKFKHERDTLNKVGASAGNIAELDRQEKEALDAIDKQFGERQEAFKAFANDVARMSLQQLTKLLEEAQTKLVLARMNAGQGLQLGHNDDVALYSAEIAKLKELITSLQKGTSEMSKGSFNDWKRLVSVLDKVDRELRDIGDSIGGVAGEFISLASTITTQTMSIVTSITEYTELSVQSTQAAAEGASKAIQTVEKASVILAVISAALKIINVIKDGFSALKESEKEHQEYLKSVKDLQDDYNMSLIETRMLHDEVWGKNLIGDVMQDITALGEATDAYFEKLSEQQQKHVDPTGGFFKNLYKYGTIMGWMGLGTGSSDNGMASLRENLRYITKKSSKGFLGIGGNHTQTQGLEEWVKENLGTDLFDPKTGRIDLELAVNLVDNYSDRLTSGTKESLEGLIELEKMIQEAETSMKDYISTTFGTLGNEISDGIIEAFRNGTDAAEAFRNSTVGILEEIGEQIVRNLFVQKQLEQLEKDLFPIYEQYSKNGDTEKFTKELMSTLNMFWSGMTTTLENADEFMNMFQSSASKYGYDLYKPDETNTSYSENTLKGAYAKASQESIDLLAGQFGALRVDVKGIRDIFQMMSPANNGEYAAGIRANQEALYALQEAGWKDVAIIKELSGKLERTNQVIADQAVQIRTLSDKISTNTEEATRSLQNIESNGIKVNLPPI